MSEIHYGIGHPTEVEIPADKDWYVDLNKDYMYERVDGEWVVRYHSGVEVYPDGTPRELYDIYE